jgi:hypothetical protein
MKVVEEAANAVLSRRNAPGAPVSGSWVRRWLRADRALAREEALSNGIGEPPEIDLVEAEIDNDDEDANSGEDAPSETEIGNNNQISSMLPPSLDSDTTAGTEQLVNKAAEALTNIESSLSTGPSILTGP